MKEGIRKLLKHFGLRITRWGLPSRFQAMDETLVLLRDMGYRPGVVIDGGANIGQWTRKCRGVFRDAEIHIVEPLPSCQADLRRLAAELGRVHVHSFALTWPGVSVVRFLSSGEADKGTGNHIIAANDQRRAVEVEATTLDALFADRIGPADRTFLKLDLEGHEVYALSGAVQMLRHVEVIVSEVQFFPISDNGLPTFTDLLVLLREHGFVLFDFACLSQRPRDGRLKMGDVVFVRQGSALLTDCSL